MPSSKLVSFKEEAGWLLKPHRDEAWQSARSLGYDADIYVPTRASDLGNREKALTDSLQESLGFNDNRIETITLRRHIDGDNPHIDVKLYTLT